MTSLTDHGAALRDTLTSRFGLSEDAALSMMLAVHNGGGNQAQFSHPELGGMCQWSAGGMTMVGDMFNTGLQAQVAGICAEISNAYFQGPFYPPRPATGSFQAQGGPSMQMQGGSFGAWWPSDLGQPSSSGSQNNLSYAFFPQTCRLAVNLNGAVTVYDTGDHVITGVGQQQSGDASWTFTSQFGTVYVSDLPVVTDGTEATGTPRPVLAPAPDPAPAATDPAEADTPPAAPAPRTPSPDDILSTLERLGALMDKGILTQEEFSAKKAELLARL